MIFHYRESRCLYATEIMCKNFFVWLVLTTKCDLFQLLACYMFDDCFHLFGKSVTRENVDYVCWLCMERQKKVFCIELVDKKQF